ncbi:T9SS type A sorting domain-containing protein [Kaistella palustris]|uniref:T9SS type A sorting domain-containing protein n=1 Tax=Kaistella palustris TaxID=493376 RepID=UPI00041DCD4B|nr:T9SS type A sorting domain-containing protein [Kaistella palustris]
MRKIYFLLLLVFSFSANCQPYSVLLQDTDWTIVRINWQGTDYYPPPPFSSAGKVVFDAGESGGFASVFFNTAGGQVTFGADNQKFFTLQSVGVTLMEYHGENQAAVQQFDEMVTGFYFGFPPDEPFTFDYQQVFSGRNLTVTNSVGNTIFYSNQILSSENSALKNAATLYPNPARNEFYLKPAKNISGKITVEIFDASGKFVSTQKLAHDLKIDTSLLPTGNYMVKVIGLNLPFNTQVMIRK